MDSVKHYCGVVGIFSQEKSNIPEQLYFPLFSLQHRGQESAGITYVKEERFATFKDLGSVGSVLSHYLNEEHLSYAGIGHVRYSTAGGNLWDNAQPIHITCNRGEIALAHNGNISNADKLRERLSHEGAIFQSTSDTELVLHMLSRSRKIDFFDGITEVLKHLEGAFSMVLLHRDMLIGIRDPLGFRPLYIGQKEGMTMIASETCALDTHEITEYRSVEPGEMVIVTKEGVRSERFNSSPRIAQCVFEMIYFARPDSEIYNQSVHINRKKMGAALAKVDTVEADLVIPVPDSGNFAALGYSQESGVPFDFGLTRNHFAGRSFIQPTKSKREMAVKMKLHPNKETLKGKRVIMVDDSLVRGTTSRTIVKLLRQAGASEVHLRLSSPELHWPCFFGIDVPTRDELISNHKTPDEIAEMIGADSVMFLPIEELEHCVEEPNKFCYACFNGDYPVHVPLKSEGVLKNG
ncbi:amidophosphoribosyltransferase [Spirochaeta cellobiosiphila]|uniref:amidophosphoribosyltransferase n=1 Tax=Spirochaeta cellobiosiphila TaxID=504483 RepID=UPI0004256195|nr:amidophosphoribosyltransferase [Spirochaeta cellobiosiphila]